MKIVLDTRQLLIFFKGEKNAETVKDILELIENGSIEGFVNAITLTEIYYIYFRIDKKIAEERVNQIKQSMKIVPIEENIAIQAGMFKGQYKIPIADSLIAASAYLLNATVISDDPDFRKIKDLNIMDESTFWGKWS